MRTEYFVSVINETLNDGSTLGPYDSRAECKQFISGHNKLLKNPKVIFISDDKIIYRCNDIVICYEIIIKEVNK